MEKLRNSSFLEFEKNFLVKYFNERLQDDGWVTTYMCQQHTGKIDQPILWGGTWTEEKITDKSELESLICVTGWTEEVGLIKDGEKNRRLLSTFVKNAKEMDYFNSKDERRIHWLRKFKVQVPEFTGFMRIVLREPCPGEAEENPNGKYYLHDGLGRLLPLLYMMEYEQTPMPLIHALVARSHPVPLLV